MNFSARESVLDRLNDSLPGTVGTIEQVVYLSDLADRHLFTSGLFEVKLIKI